MVEEKLAQFVRPGDLILVTTPNVLYESMRKLYESRYDHVVVVVDEDRCLNITYPKAKLVPVRPFLLMQREPLVVRVNWTSDLQRKQFISNLKHSSVGKRYDSQRVFQYFRTTFLEKLGV